jgi:signal peptidase
VAARLVGRAAGVAGAAALTVGVAALVAVAAGPAVGAWRLAPVRSGSMAPALPAGSLAVAVPAPAPAVRPGWVIVFHRPGDAAVVTHRVVRVLAGGAHPVVETRGDANPVADPWRLRITDDRVWRVRAVVPGAGRALLAMRAPPVRLATTAGVPLVLGVAWAVAIVRAPEPGAEPRPRRRRVGRHRRHRPAPVAARAVAGCGRAHARPAPVPGGPWRRSADDVLPAVRGSRWGRRAAAVLAVAALVVLGAPSAARAAIGDAAAVSQGQITTDTLAAPTNVAAVGGCRSVILGPKVALTWTPTASAYATGYEVRRATSAGGPYTLVATLAGRSTASWTDTSVSAGTTYWYRLRSTYLSWSSADTPAVSATTPALCL